MTAKKINKIDIELSPKVKRVAMSTASILLGASLMGTAKPIKKIVGDKYDDEIGLVVKADTIEGTENSSDVVTTVDQEDQTSSETENTTSTNEVSNNQNLESSEDNASNNELSGKMLQIVFKQQQLLRKQQIQRLKLLILLSKQQRLLQKQQIQ